MGRHDVIQCDPGWLPVFFGYCPSEKAWDRFVKKVGMKGEPYPNRSGGAMSRLTNDKGHVYLLVTLNEDASYKAPWSTADFIVHEGVHVWQHIKDIIGEDAPSKEFEAYSIQHIVAELTKAWKKARKR